MIWFLMVKGKKYSCCTCDTLFGVIFLTWSAKRRRDIFIDNPRLISAGSHWIKLIMWYKIGRWLSEIIRRPIRHPSFDFISTEETPRNGQTFKLMRRWNRNFGTPSPGQTSSIWLLSCPGEWGFWPLSRQSGENWTGSGRFQIISFFGAGVANNYKQVFRRDGGLQRKR